MIFLTTVVPVAVGIAGLVLAYWMFRHPAAMRDHPTRRLLPLSLLMTAIAIRATAEVIHRGDEFGLLPAAMLWLISLAGLWLAIRPPKIDAGKVPVDMRRKRVSTRVQEARRVEKLWLKGTIAGLLIGMLLGAIQSLVSGHFSLVWTVTAGIVVFVVLGIPAILFYWLGPHLSVWVQDHLLRRRPVDIER